MKRSRHTVNISRPGSFRAEDKVILSYGPQDAVDYFNRLGYKVNSVRKGDFVNCKPQGGWHVDRAVLREAIAELDLKWPVRIKQGNSQGGQRGVHRLRHEAHPQRGIRAIHEIRVKSYLDAETASHVLRHELKHAQQAERALRNERPSEIAGVGAYSVAAAQSAWSAYREVHRPYGKYKESSLEREAREYQFREGHKPLARKGKR